MHPPNAVAMSDEFVVALDEGFGALIVRKPELHAWDR